MKSWYTIILNYISNVIHPHSRPKFYWDMVIIILSIANAINIPIEIAFSFKILPVTILDYVMDAIFMIDIVVNFRTIIVDEEKATIIKESKDIARAYIFSGRFFLDLAASLPVEILSDVKVNI